MYVFCRLFVLLSALGQRSVRSGQFVESILQLVSRQLSVLIQPITVSAQGSVAALDTTLLSWLLLFISRCLDGIAPPSRYVSDKDGKSRSRDREAAATARWDFLQGEAALHHGHASLGAAAKTSRRRLQKRLVHHKQHLKDVQHAKKIIEKIIPSGTPNVHINIMPTSKSFDASGALVYEQGSMLKSYLKQQSSKV